jgi:hypothetical protein
MNFNNTIAFNNLMLITAVVVFIVMVTGLALIANEFIDETNEKKIEEVK